MRRFQRHRRICEVMKRETNHDGIETAWCEGQGLSEAFDEMHSAMHIYASSQLQIVMCQIQANDRSRWRRQGRQQYSWPASDIKDIPLVSQSLADAGRHLSHAQRLRRTKGLRLPCEFCPHGLVVTHSHLRLGCASARSAQISHSRLVREYLSEDRSLASRTHQPSPNSCSTRSRL